MKVSFDARDIGRLLVLHLIQEGYDVNEADLDIPPNLAISVNGLTRSPNPPRQGVQLVSFAEGDEAPVAETPVATAPAGPSKVPVELDGIQNPEVLIQSGGHTRLVDVPRGPNGLARWSSRVGVVGDPTTSAPPEFPEETRVRRTISVGSKGETRLVPAGDPQAVPLPDPPTPYSPRPTAARPALVLPPLVAAPDETIFQQLRRQRGGPRGGSRG